MPHSPCARTDGSPSRSRRLDQHWSLTAKARNKAVDAAIDLWDDINRFLRQRVDEKTSITESIEALLALHKKIQARMAASTPAAAAVATNVQAQQK